MWDDLRARHSPQSSWRHSRPLSTPPSGETVAAEAASWKPRATIDGLPHPAHRLDEGVDRRAWFGIDSEPCFVMARDGVLIDLNGAGQTMLESGIVRLSRDRRLDLGSRASNGRVSLALDGLRDGRAETRRLVAQGADGAWRSWELHWVETPSPLIFLSVRAQAVPRPDAMAPLIEAFHLTPAQAEVLHLLMEGAAPKEIGGAMRVSTHTVRTHLRAIYLKLQVHGIAGALRLASQLIS